MEGGFQSAEKEAFNPRAHEEMSAADGYMSVEMGPS